MHIKLTKTEKPQTPRAALTPDTIAQAVADYFANGGRVTVCPTPRKR